MKEEKKCAIPVGGGKAFDPYLVQKQDTFEKVRVYVFEGGIKVWDGVKETIYTIKKGVLKKTLEVTVFNEDESSVTQATTEKKRPSFPPEPLVEEMEG